MFCKVGAWFSVGSLGVLLSVGLATNAGCGSEGGPGAQTPGEARSDLQRASPSAADQEAAWVLAEDNASFGLSLLRHLSVEEPGNLFLSPLSISVAFAMLHGGARGETAAELADVLQFELEGETLHAAFNATTSLLEWCDEESCLAMANSLWGEDGAAFESDFLDLLAIYYGAGVHLVDFTTDPEGARAAINDWVAERTEQHLKELIPQGYVDALTRFVLANAVYLRAAWKRPFETFNTADGPFFRRDGTQVTVPRMRQTGGLPYLRAGDVQALELPYAGTLLGMVILLPDPGQMDAVLETLDGSSLQAMFAGLSDTTVSLTLPRFELEASFSLDATLRSMGMNLAFSGGDFSGMMAEPVSVQAVLHQAWIRTDESGTEATAATVIIGGADGGVDIDPPEPTPFVVDRPFLFVIWHRVTHAVIFLGKVEDPSAT